MFFRIPNPSSSSSENKKMLIRQLKIMNKDGNSLNYDIINYDLFISETSLNNMKESNTSSAISESNTNLTSGDTEDTNEIITPMNDNYPWFKIKINDNQNA